MNNSRRHVTPGSETKVLTHVPASSVSLMFKSVPLASQVPWGNTGRCCAGKVAGLQHSGETLNLGNEVPPFSWREILLIFQGCSQLTCPQWRAWAKSCQRLTFFVYPSRICKSAQGRGLNLTVFVFALFMDSVVFNVFDIFHYIAVIILFDAQIVSSLDTEA